MKKKILMFSRMVLVAFLVASMNSCSDDDEGNGGPECPDCEEQNPIYKDGMETVTRFYEDDKIIEEVHETVVNLGPKDQEALFFVNTSHKQKGKDVAPGKADMNCVFNSLTMDEYERFIKVFAVKIGIINANENFTLEAKQATYKYLEQFIKGSNIELPYLVYLTENDVEQLKAMDEIIAAVPKHSKNNNINSVMSAMLNKKVSPTQLKSMVEGEGMTMKSFMAKAELYGVDFANELQSRGGTAITVIKAIVKGAVIVSKITIWIIENAEPVVNMNNEWASYINEKDLDPSHYYQPVEYTSPKYFCEHYAALFHLASAKFYIRTHYASRHEFLPGRYIPRVGVYVDEVHCVLGQHVEGEMSFYPGEERSDATDSPIAVCNGEVIIHYGDCCAFQKRATLRYKVDGKSGYTPLSWEPDGKD